MRLSVLTGLSTNSTQSSSVCTDFEDSREEHVGNSREARSGDKA